METRTRDLLFGTGRTGDDLRGTFAPRGWGGAGQEKGSVLSTFKGIGPNGWGKEAGLKAAERVGLISAEQRAAGGGVASAATGAVEAGQVRGLVGGSAAASAAGIAPQYANPVYGGAYGQMLMAQGFTPPFEAPADSILAHEATYLSAADAPQVASAGDDAGATIAAAADNAVDDVVALEQRLLTSFQRLSDMPMDQKVSALSKAVDTTAAAGHGGDAFDVLAESLASRPLADAADALDGAINDVIAGAKVAAPLADDVTKVVAPIADNVAPVVDDVAHAAAPVLDDVIHAAAPVADTVAEVVAKAVPKVIESAVPKVVDAALPAVMKAATARSLLIGGTDALRGVMPFAAGVDDTLRLLGKL